MSAPQRPALVAADVWFSYAATRPVVRGVTLGAAAGDITMIVGASGSGKTTLLKLCKGLLTPQRGSVSVFGEAVVAARGRRLDPSVAYIPQHLGLVRNLGVMDNVLTGALGRVAGLPSLLHHFPRAEVQRARDLLDLFGIGHKANDKVYALSGGERQRVAIARALMQRPRLLVADEFVSQLDVLTTREIMGIVEQIARDGVAVVVATHDMEIVERYADTVVVLRNGEKVLERRGPGHDLADLTAVLR